MQVLSQLFSGEEATYRCVTEKTREISSNTPFCILGATPVLFANWLVLILDQGHGLIDRFLITFPNCLRPTPIQTSQAVETLTDSTLSLWQDAFIEIAQLHTYHLTYTLIQEANDTVKNQKDRHDPVCHSFSPCVQSHCDSS